MNRVFKVRYGSWVSLATVGIFILLGYSIYNLYKTPVISYDNSNVIAMSITAVVSTVLLIFGYLFTAKEYVLTNDKLIIRRPIKPIEIELKSIIDIEEIANKLFFGFIRTFGNGGVFGIVGKHYHPKYKFVKFYSGKVTNLVLIKSRNGNYVISPKQGFVETIKELL